MSGYQDEFKDEQDFKDKYEDFFALGQDEFYIKVKNMFASALEQSRKSSYKRRLTTIMRKN